MKKQNKKQKTILPICALIFASVFWGINTPLIKMGVESIPVTIFISIRFLAASLILLPFAIRTWKPLKRKDLLLAVLSSIFGITLSALAMNVGLTKTTAINAGVIWLLSPLILFVLSASLLNEKLNMRVFIGIMVALSGSLVIIGKPWESGLTDANELAGNLLIVVAIFCATISTLICKPLTKKMSTYQLTFLGLFPGVIPVAIYAITQLPEWDVQATTSTSVHGLVFSTLVVVAANFLFYYGLRYKKAQSTGVYQYIDPLTTMVAAWFLLSERPSSTFALGACLIFLGVYLGEIYRSPKAHRAKVA